MGARVLHIVLIAQCPPLYGRYCVLLMHLLVTLALDLPVHTIKLCSLWRSRPCCRDFYKRDPLMHGVCVVICTCSVHSSTASSTVLLIAFHQSSIWKPDIGQESYFVPSLPAFDAPVTGLYIAITFGVKTRMVWLHDGEKFWRCFLYSFWWITHTWQTDRYHWTA